MSRVFASFLAPVALLAYAPTASAQAFPFFLDVDICMGQPGNFPTRGTQCVYPDTEGVGMVEAGGVLSTCIVDPLGGPGQVFDAVTWPQSWTKTNNQVTMDISSFTGLYLVGALAGGGTSGGVLVDAAGLATPTQSQLGAWDGVKVQQQAWDDCVAGTGGGGGSIQFDYTGGIELWDVPPGVTIVTIEATGAAGGPNTQWLGGAGAYLSGDFNVSPGETLTVAVGGIGTPGDYQYGHTGGGGGGGTGVLSGYNALVIAGGGGGAGHQTQGQDAVLGINGTEGFGQYVGFGGFGGIDGADGEYNDFGTAAGGRGWNFGVPTPGDPMTHPGGWGLGGGGGGAGVNGHGGGGGGGYSGGGGAWDGGGGGAGSLNNGFNQLNTAAVGTGDGVVIISW